MEEASAGKGMETTRGKGRWKCLDALLERSRLSVRYSSEVRVWLGLLVA